MTDNINDNKYYLISDENFFSRRNLRLNPIQKLDGVIYSTDRIFLCIVNQQEFTEIQSNCTTRELINTQIEQGDTIYCIVDRTDELSTGNESHFCLQVYVYDLYEPNTLQYFPIKFTSQEYMKNCTPKMKEYIQHLYAKAAEWKVLK